jgi:hypothetical protein
MGVNQTVVCFWQEPRGPSTRAIYGGGAQRVPTWDGSDSAFTTGH